MGLIAGGCRTRMADARRKNTNCANLHSNESDGYNCYNEFIKEGIEVNLLITCDFLGGLEEKPYFCNIIKRLKGEGYGIRNKKHSCSYR